MEDYQQHYSPDTFRDKLKRFAGSMGKELVTQALTLYYMGRDPAVPNDAKLMVFAALGYLILPTDFIPDFIPGVGFSDDLGALVITISMLSKNVTAGHRQQAKTLVEKWFSKPSGPGSLDDEDVIDI